MKSFLFAPITALTAHRDKTDITSTRPSRLPEGGRVAARSPIAPLGGAAATDTQPVKLLWFRVELCPTAAAAEGRPISHLTGIWVTGVNTLLGELRPLYIFTILFSVSFYLLSVVHSSLPSKSPKFPLTFSPTALPHAFLPSPSTTPLLSSLNLHFIAQAF